MTATLLNTMSPDAPIREAIRLLEADTAKIVLLLDEQGRLAGTVTDGDIRRGILKGITVEAPAHQVMNARPIVATAQDSGAAMLALMKARQVRHLPIVDSRGVLIGLETLSRLTEAREHDNAVVLMAGGFGRRLRPHTEAVAKPMVMVGTKPLLETIITNFCNCGFRRFFVSVHYRAEDIKQHFGDGSRWGVSIEYLEESEALGTAGALRLLPDRPTHPFLVMNADVLTNVNFHQLLDFHLEQQVAGTLCAREFDLQVPYGVVEVDDGRFAGITEKPVYKFLVSAGIYVLDPVALDHMPARDAFDMPTLFQRMHENSQRSAVFPLREYWLDIGQVSDLERARLEFDDVFGK